MVALQSPLIDAQMDDQTRMYVSVLERQVVGLSINEMKYRALLEYLTGKPWDDMKVDLEANELEKIAIEAVQNKMNVSASTARKIVAERKSAASGETAEAPPVPPE